MFPPPPVKNSFKSSAVVLYERLPCFGFVGERTRRSEKREMKGRECRVDGGRKDLGTRREMQKRVTKGKEIGRIPTTAGKRDEKRLKGRVAWANKRNEEGGWCKEWLGNGRERVERYRKKEVAEREEGEVRDRWEWEMNKGFTKTGDVGTIEGQWRW